MSKKEKSEKEETNYTTISLPKPLVEKIKKRCEGTGFNSVSSYVTYVLRQVISNIETKEEPEKESSQPQTTGPRPQTKEAFSKEDEDIVRERLKALGYIQ